MSDLLKEINDEVYYDKIIKLLRPYLPHIAIAIILAVVLSCGTLWYKSYKSNSTHQDGGNYLLAIGKIRSENLKEGLKIFEDVGKNSSNYAGLARLNTASYAIYNKDLTKASQILNSISVTNSYHPTIRALANLYEIEINFEDGTKSKSETIDLIKLYIGKDNDFKILAQEFLITLLLDENDKAEALALIDQLSTNPNVPSSMLLRLDQYRALVN